MAKTTVADRMRVKRDNKGKSSTKRHSVPHKGKRDKAAKTKKLQSRRSGVTGGSGKATGFTENSGKSVPKPVRKVATDTKGGTNSRRVNMSAKSTKSVNMSSTKRGVTNKSSPQPEDRDSSGFRQGK